MTRATRPEIAQFILDHVDEHPRDVGPITAGVFGVTRATATNYLKRLVAEGLLLESGKTKAKTYALRILDGVNGAAEIGPGSEDDAVWRAEIRPRMSELPENVLQICQYGFTEMVNNAIDHSGSPTYTWGYNRTAKQVVLWVKDEGVGIFEKIRLDCKLNDDREALLELAKGKLTSDPKRHTGEGIFFTSRMFDRFQLYSHHLQYDREREDNDQWLLEVTNPEHYTPGTGVIMKLDVDTARVPAEVFKKYEDDNSGFSKTHFHVALAKIGDDQLISRSQARRLVARLEKFTEVCLDFVGVATIGQGFADEIFRVFQSEHPNVHIEAIRTSPEVRSMIDHVLAAASGDRQQALL
jgi:anti-sigma regulatory factor (Ser/Thr protein kinase)